MSNDNDRAWGLIYRLSEADLMDDDEREAWIAAGMPLDKYPPPRDRHDVTDYDEMLHSPEEDR